ncbi:hypothetical protein [Bacillus toyonensis]|uniref:hypothetical protein n=1 Tax=Bacillus toyonensis TaxID=155322 RepID=UPI002100125D|nr:hypothetical protein [Bacillus toyonensis]
MKLTLFTISNEQIKEQLSKLQTKVESLETVKDVQDKIISAKDSQITFLQGEISNITSWVTWGAAAVSTLASAAFIYIKFLERKAKKKIEEAENTLQLAKEKLTEIETAKQKTETNLTESNVKIEQLDKLIDKSNDIATVAQEKLGELEQQQLQLQSQANAMENKHKLDMLCNHIKTDLDFIQKRMEGDRRFCSNKYIHEFNEFSHKTSELEAKYLVFSTEIRNKITNNITITENNIKKIEQLKENVKNFMDNYISFYLKIRSSNNEN